MKNLEITLFSINIEKVIKNFANYSWNFSNISFWPKANMQISAYKKVFSLNFSRNLLYSYFHWKFSKSFEVVHFEIEAWKRQGGVMSKDSALKTISDKIHAKS